MEIYLRDVLCSIQTVENVSQLFDNFSYYILPYIPLLVTTNDERRDAQLFCSYDSLLKCINYRITYFR